MKGVYYNFLIIILGLILNNAVYSQELEPRALTNLPIGTSLIVSGYGFASGNVLMDPSLPLEDLDAQMHTFFGAYVRSINFFGMSAKVDVVLPYGTGDWYYTYEGNDEYDLSNGFGDVRLRFSFNILGAKALDKKQYKDYEQKTIVGYSLQMIMPTGNYKNDQLPNLGSNRWTFKNQLGISHKYKKWFFELYASLWFFTSNNDFLDGNKFSQKPLLGFKGHIIKSLPKKFWIELGAAYGYGGRTLINDTARDALISTLRLGLTLAIPLAPQHSLKLVGLSGIRFKQGPDFDAVTISYQYMWNRK